MRSVTRLLIALVAAAAVAGVLLGPPTVHRTSNRPVAARLCLAVVVEHDDPGVCVPLP